MQTIISYRNLTVSNSQLLLLQTLIAENPSDCRSELSRKLCRLFNWVQPNGVLRDMVCRSLLLKLENAGHIKLPPRRGLPQQLRKKSNCQTELFSDDDFIADNTLAIQTTLKALYPLSIIQVRRTKAETLYKQLIKRYHYLGYTQPVGEHLKYIIYSANRPIACISFSSAPRHIGSRDRFIGWDPQIRRQNIHLVAYNTRFLILPWVRVPHLASHILGLTTRRISGDWQQLYNHPLYFLETFVDTERFAGTCYKAANWIYLGVTTGRGKNDMTHRQNRSIKAVWGLPLVKNFREKLCHE